MPRPRSPLAIIALVLALAGCASSPSPEPSTSPSPRTRAPRIAVALAREGRGAVWLVGADGRDGRFVELPGGRAAADPIWAADGSFLTVTDETGDLWRLAPDGGTPSRLGSAWSGGRGRGVWAPPGGRYAFYLDTGRVTALDRRSGAFGELELPTAGFSPEIAGSILSPDRRHALVACSVIDLASARVSASTGIDVLACDWTADGRVVWWSDSQRDDRLLGVDGSDLGPAGEDEVLFEPERDPLSFDPQAPGEPVSPDGAHRIESDADGYFTIAPGGPELLAGVSDRPPGALGWSEDGRAAVLLDANGWGHWLDLTGRRRGFLGPLPGEPLGAPVIEPGAPDAVFALDPALMPARPPGAGVGELPSFSPSGCPPQETVIALETYLAAAERLGDCELWVAGWLAIAQPAGDGALRAIHGEPAWLDPEIPFLLAPGPFWADSGGCRHCPGATLVLGAPDAPEYSALGALDTVPGYRDGSEHGRWIVLRGHRADRRAGSCRAVARASDAPTPGSSDEAAVRTRCRATFLVSEARELWVAG